MLSSCLKNDAGRKLAEEFSPRIRRKEIKLPMEVILHGLLNPTDFKEILDRASAAEAAAAAKQASYRSRTRE